LYALAFRVALFGFARQLSVNGADWASQKENELNEKTLARSSQHFYFIIGNDNGKLITMMPCGIIRLERELVFVVAASKGLTIGKTVVSFNDEKLKRESPLSTYSPENRQAKNMAPLYGNYRLRRRLCWYNKNLLEHRNC
jgi:hypothetical protein